MDREGLVVDRSFDEWYRAERPRLHSALIGILGDQAVAGDVVDEALARACERWDRVGSMESPGGWTFRTALNLARRRGRRQAMESRLFAVLGRDRSSVRLAEGAAGDPEVIDVLRALQELPIRMREVVVLYYIADRPVAEIATALRLSTGTVTSTLHDARQRLLAGSLGADRASRT